MHKKLLVSALTLSLIGALLANGSMVAQAATTVSFDPSVVSVAPGNSVVGDGLLMCGLVIGNSGNNPVAYIQQGQTPSAYGANNSPDDLNSFQNGFLPTGFGIADLGDGSDVTTKTHQYDFSFSSGTTVNTFTIGVVDWGDYLPNAKGMAGHHEMILTAYDSSNAVINSQSLAFDTDYSDKAVNRQSPQFGNMQTAGDAGAAFGQPGNFSLTVSGSGIARVELRYADAISVDPNIGISNISYMLEDGEVATRCALAQNPSPTPTPTPSGGSGGGTDSSNNDSSNPSPAPSTSPTTGSVLGASTLADTGAITAEIVSIIFTLGAALTAIGLNLRFRK